MCVCVCVCRGGGTHTTYATMQSTPGVRQIMYAMHRPIISMSDIITGLDGRIKKKSGFFAIKKGLHLALCSEANPGSRQ